MKFHCSIPWHSYSFCLKKWFLYGFQFKMAIIVFDALRRQTRAVQLPQLATALRQTTIRLEFLFWHRRPSAFVMACGYGQAERLRALYGIFRYWWHRNLFLVCTLPKNIYGPNRLNSNREAIWLFKRANATYEWPFQVSTWITNDHWITNVHFKLFSKK